MSSISVMPNLTYGWIDFDDPASAESPLNIGLRNWWLVSPTISGGGYWYDFMGRSPGVMTNFGVVGTGWRSSARPGGVGSILFRSASAQKIDAGTLSWLQDVPTGVLYQYTTSMWFRRTSAGSLVQMAYGGTGIQLWTLAYSDGNVYGSPDGSGFGYFACDDTSWHHLICVYNAAVGSPTDNDERFQMYLDGRRQTLSFIGSMLTGVSIPDGNRFAIGSDGSDATFTDGNIDDVRLYDRPISAREARTLYEESAAGYPTALNYRPVVFQGVEAPPPAYVDPGLFSAFDFTGINVGAGTPEEAQAVSVGFLGLLDFVGYPVGAGTPVSPAGGGTYAAGKRVLRYYLEEQMRRRSVLEGLEASVAVDTLLHRVANQWAEYQYELARHRSNTILAALLSEV